MTGLPNIDEWLLFSFNHERILEEICQNQRQNICVLMTYQDMSSIKEEHIVEVSS